MREGTVMTQLDESAAMVLELVRLSNAPTTDSLSPSEAREGFSRARIVFNPPSPELTEVRDLSAPGPHGPISLRLYRDGTDAAPRAGLIYFHGGGWVIGDLDTHDVVCRQIAQLSGAVVISVDYRMAPEHKFPAAVDDAIAATAWICAEAASFGIDPLRVAVGGDSAGGNLATVVAIAARDHADSQVGPKLAGQVLIYPSADMTAETESHRQFRDGYMLTHAVMQYFRGHYLNSDADREDWRASPNKVTDLSGLPCALVITAGFDPLRDEGEAYAMRMVASGVPVTIRRFTGQIHGFLTMGRMVPQADTAIADISAFLRML
jgi:acetyl esterase